MKALILLMVQIRFEKPTDIPAIQRVNELAFGQSNEASLIDTLRSSQALVLSMVASEEGEVVGHIAFSPVTIQDENAFKQALGLGPMAVLPSHQRKGIGSKLIEEALIQCSKLDYELVVVLGHPDYYPRFGFAPSKPYGIEWEIPVPDEAFMVRELKPGMLSSIKGVVRYHPAFTSV